MENRFYRDSELRITAEKRDGKTIISKSYFTPPFKVMLPFYDCDYDREVMQVLQMTASPGIMEGDVQKFEFDVLDNAKMEYFTQSFEKVHKMHDGHGRRDTYVHIHKNAFLDYHPLPIIPYADSAVYNTYIADLEDDTSQFLFEEILCSGRVAFGESFDYRLFNNLVEVRKAGKLIYRDNAQYRPDMFDMSGVGMYEGYTHLGNQIYFNIEKSDEWIAEALHIMKENEDVDGAITRLGTGDVAVRCYAYNADPIIQLFTKLKHLTV